MEQMYIGIDLGTSNSVIAGLEDGEARVFRPADGGEVLPSVIYVDKRGHRLYGRRAYDQASIAPENVAAGFKRLMGTSTPIDIKGANVTLTPEECSAEIIRQLLGQAETETGKKEITGAIITVPAAFNQMQSEATLRAARLAGIEHVDLLQEPVAAALAAMAGAKRSGQFLIYDLGGGTFDVALAQALNGEVKIIAHQGINMLGGRDFDRMIVNEVVRPWLMANFDLPENFQRDKQYQRIIRLATLAAEKAKIDLSMLEQASIFASDDEVRMMDQSDVEIFLDAPITRSQFEEMIREPIMQTVNLVRSLLEENNYKSEDIDRIVFIGGPSRIPLVRQMVSDELGIAADLKTDPMTAVAIGATYYCESREWKNGGEPKPATGLAETVSAYKQAIPTPLPSPAESPSGSTPKPKQASIPVPEAEGEDTHITFDYTQRTADEKTVVTIRVKDPSPRQSQIRITSKTWDSDVLPLVDGLTVMVPLSVVGNNEFKAQVLDDKGVALSQHDQTIIVTRVVAAVSNINASQAISVKALESSMAQENILLPLVTKGMPLPASGQAKFKSGRALTSGATGSISFELFQVEYPERIDLNLCVGLFRVEGRDLPEGKSITVGDQIIFDWNMSDGGILEATVRLPQSELELRVPRFYAPQAGQMSFSEDKGSRFADAVLRKADEEWGDLSAALGPDGGPEVQLLKVRLVEQREILDETSNDPETLRRVVEETRFIRQDIARLGKKHRKPMLQRQLGKMTSVFNRVARGGAEKAETERFDNHADAIQQIIDDGAPEALDDAQQHLSEMRGIFFDVAWRNADYVLTWFKRLSNEPYIFPDQTEFQAMITDGEALQAKGDREGLRGLVKRLLDSRIAFGASDIAGELATIVKW